MRVSDKVMNMKMKSTGEDVSTSHGMVLWSTGVGSRSVVKDFMEQIGQVCLHIVLMVFGAWHGQISCYSESDTNVSGGILELFLTLVSK